MGQIQVTVTTSLTIADAELFDELQTLTKLKKRELFSKALHLLAKQLDIQPSKNSLGKEPTN